MYIAHGKISIEKLLLAKNNLIEFMAAVQTNMSMTASIQAFEYTYELYWKILRKVLIQVYGVNDLTGSAQTVFQKAAKLNLIEDLNFWLGCIDRRNETLHTYEESSAIELYDFLPKFLQELESAINKLQEIK
ncbi:MAG TPA: HI0074 family nucleotidyltransferase substrate-binding subunit [Candidatus Babeliales bacterium]|nr:HI0074 family nucleotidyltransferase substrate-binding subunit [Candidatus Babeliales bacterium]